MIICWDNLEKLRFNNKTGNWYTLSSNTTYKYVDECDWCKKPFLSAKGQETRCSKSCARSGREIKYTDEWKKKIGDAVRGEKNGFFGKKHSKETRKHLSSVHTGKKLSEKTKLKLSKIFRGEGNPNWRGGLSKTPYCIGWNYLTKELKEYDNNECQNPICEGEGSRITSHHIDYNKQNCHPSNLITLCNSCNAKANYNRELWQRHYMEVKARLNI